jgi:6-phosphogluconate dehydrogenase
MIGLGRMGANMARRLMKGGHECVVYDRNAGNVDALVKEGAIGASSLEDVVKKLKAP